MKKFQIFIALFCIISCQNPSIQLTKTQSNPSLETYKSRYADVVNNICRNLDIKHERDGVYKTSEGECVVVADHMVKDGEQCKYKIQCEVEAMRKDRLQRVKEKNQRDLFILETLTKHYDKRSILCKDFKNYDDSELFFKDSEGNCKLKAKYKRSR